MNKYEVLFDEILKQTQSRELQWKQLRRQAHSDLIFEAGRVFRQFSANFSRAANNFQLLLVEKKLDDAFLNFCYRKYRVELLVLDDEGELITTLTDSVIDQADLMQLVDMVTIRSDKAGKLFAPGPQMQS